MASILFNPRSKKSSTPPIQVCAAGHGAGGARCLRQELSICYAGVRRDGQVAPPTSAFSGMWTSQITHAGRSGGKPDVGSGYADRKCPMWQQLYAQGTNDECAHAHSSYSRPQLLVLQCRATNRKYAGTQNAGASHITYDPPSPHRRYYHSTFFLLMAIEKTPSLSCTQTFTNATATSVHKVPSAKPVHN